MLVLGALAATAVVAGPRAWRNASAQLRAVTDRGEGGTGVAVPLDRLEGFAAPAWLQGDLLRVLLEDLEPRLRGEVRLMDDEAARSARDQIEASAFVIAAQLERRFPDRFHIELEVRRAEVQVLDAGQVVALLDASGIALPSGTGCPDLPQIDVDGYDPPVPTDRIRFGAEFPDVRVVAAAEVAGEWREDLAPKLAGAAPTLRAIDARNVQWRWIANIAVSQLLICVERSDGGLCWLQYGVAERGGGSVSTATRARILESMLVEHPGLAGVARGDLRRLNVWRAGLIIEDGR